MQPDPGSTSRTLNLPNLIDKRRNLGCFLLHTGAALVPALGSGHSWSSALPSSAGTARNGLRLHHERFELDIREIFFPGRVLRHGNAPPRAAGCLEVLRKGVDVAPGDMGYCWRVGV